MAFQLLMSNLTARTNAQTNMGEMWWGEYLQIDETRTEFQGMCPIPITVNLKIYSLLFCKHSELDISAYTSDRLP